ncbi:O-antigen ligase [Geobacillus sp. DSP4a]|uniref:O-antigen ligase family protein n=1 Tax=Geobacillus sp. DSP4a TaxID=2508873 RepID=UPI001492FF48|nr:hypothetical protein [Geobacillus sp. DSP4a]NNU98271.1 hypothetical protein [Geobacillus sp. DSP4a]
MKKNIYIFLNKLQIILIGIIMIVLQLPFIRQIDFFSKVKYYLLALIIIFFILSYIKLAGSKYQIVKNYSLSIIIALIFLFSLLNVLINGNYASFINQILFMLFPLLAGIMFAHNKEEIKFGKTNSSSISHLLLIIISIQVLSALVINMFDIDLTQFAVNDLHAYKTFYTTEGDKRIAGTLGHPIILAFVCIPLFFLSINYYKQTKNKIFLLTFILTLYVIIHTFSRGTWLGIFLSLIIYFIVSNAKSKITMTFNIIIFVIIFIYFNMHEQSSVINRFNSLLNYSNDFSVIHRKLMFSWALERYLNNDLSYITGIGYGLGNNFASIYVPSDNFPVIDNSFISMLIELGTVNMVISSILVIRALYFSYKSNVVYMYILIAMLFASLTFDISSWYLPSFMFWLIIGYNNNKQKIHCR